MRRSICSISDQREVREQGFVPCLLETPTLQALAHHVHREETLTRQALQQAFALARSQGYQCLFLDEGPALYEMLRAVLSGGAIGDWDSL